MIKVVFNHHLSKYLELGDKMKLSRFNIEIEEDNGLIIYNSLTNGVLKLNEKYSNLYKHAYFLNDLTTEESRSLFSELKKGRMIIDDKVNELNELKVIRRGLQYNNSRLTLTIAPTTSCNFTCPYCYEKGVTYHSMNEETIEKISKFVDNNLKNKNGLGICWYGGEPLLAIDSIENLTTQFKKTCEENKINYQASMITNGYLLNETNIAKLQNLSIDFVQITIDGNKSTHDNRRVLKNGEPTYDTILNNIKNIPNNIKVSIRVNIDSHNSHIVTELSEMMENEKFGDNVSLYIALVDNINNTCNSRCLDISAFSELEIKLFEKLSQTKSCNFMLPTASLGVCGANSIFSFVIGPEGEMYKCWNHIGRSEYIVGRVDEAFSLNNIICDFMLDDPTEDQKCLNCTLLPVCYGGCSDNRVRTKASKCNAVKFNIESRLKLLSMLNKSRIATNT